MSEKSALHGKAFEYAVITCLARELGVTGTIVRTAALASAEAASGSLSQDVVSDFRRAAIKGLGMIIEREPYLLEPAGDELQLFLQSDQKGGLGDVRDIVIIRPSQTWEIGISAKTNHKAVKSSRLAKELDFGASWLGLPCSVKYRSNVREIFSKLHSIRGKIAWRDLGSHGIDKYEIYKAVLNEFVSELRVLYAANGAIVAERLLRYLIGQHDFYKLMRIEDRIQLQAFNFRGALGKRGPTRKPSPEPRILPVPTKIYEIHFADQSKVTTVIVACDAGWQLSFRIHNASEFVEPSLKFDITLIGHPAELATQEVPW